MALTINRNNILGSLVKNGLFNNEIEAEKEVRKQLAKKELMRNVEEAREDYKNGRFEEVNEETDQKLIAEIEKEILVLS